MGDLYNSPQTPIVPEKIEKAGNLTETMLRYLKEASPWLRFIGIVGFVACGFIALAAVIFGVGTAISASAFGDLANFPIWLVTPLYLAFGVLLFFPSYFTYTFGEKIRKYQYTNADEDLEAAFKNNKSFWKFTGIIYIIYISTIPIMIVITIIIVFITAANIL